MSEFSFNGIPVHIQSNPSPVFKSGPVVQEALFNAPLTNPGTNADGRSRFVGQAVSQGDGAWPGGSSSSEVQDSPSPMDAFTPGGTGNDNILAIATGSAGRQNAAPDTTMSSPGLANEPTATMGTQQPLAMPGMFDPGTSPGPQGGGRSVPGLRAGEPSMTKSAPSAATGDLMDMVRTGINDTQRTRYLNLGAAQVRGGTNSQYGGESQDVSLPAYSGEFPGAPGGDIKKDPWIPHEFPPLSERVGPGPEMGTAARTSPSMQDV